MRQRLLQAAGASAAELAVAAAGLTLLLIVTGCSPDSGTADGNAPVGYESSSPATSPADTPSQHGESKPSAPVTGEVLLASAPQGWVESGTLISPVMRMAEFVPADQAEPEAPAAQESPPSADAEPAADDDSARLEARLGARLEARLEDRVTFESQSGDPLPDPIDFVLSLSRDLAPRCDGFRDFNVMSGLENNYATSVRLLICPRYKDRPLGEVLMIKAIQGRDYFYTVTRGRRLPAFGKEAQPLTAQTMAEWSAYMKAIGVCDPRRTEHPCPDTVDIHVAPGSSTRSFPALFRQGD